jgi:hypothetical protein
MVLRRWIARLLALVVVAGLTLAPLATPAAAQAPAMSGMTDMAAMSADMPCCPDAQQSKDCHDCPLVAMCALQTAQAGPSMAADLPVRYAVRTAHAVYDDVTADGLDRPPPDHPPRTLA